jgi:hypothetical protein
VSVVLEGGEARALALRLMARLAADWNEHLDWEDVPELVESSWLSLSDELDSVAREVLLASKRYDERFDVDSLHLVWAFCHRDYWRDCGPAGFIIASFDGPYTLVYTGVLTRH